MTDQRPIDPSTLRILGMRRLMGARRWTVALDGYLIPIGGGREREVYDDGEQVVLAADHDAAVRAARDAGWNAALEAADVVLESRGYAPSGRLFGPTSREAIADLRKPEVEG